MTAANSRSRSMKLPALTFSLSGLLLAGAGCASSRSPTSTGASTYPVVLTLAHPADKKEDMRLIHISKDGWVTIDSYGRRLYAHRVNDDFNNREMGSFYVLREVNVKTGRVVVGGLIFNCPM